ncbi:FAD-dependent monooxygenase [Actinoplanes sp. NPDC051851]|uniref:FAD-dependent monooxygenase n=1 Tax=Actinoplanes sp. NPDC051851 TaxID=3154753 RepID=UPI00341F7CAF
MTRPRLLIAGGGIAGLALRHALARRGVEAEVAERAPGARSGGTGLYLPANAVRALRDLGLADALGARAVPVTRQEFRDHRGRLLAGFDLSAVWGDTDGCRAVRRADLHAVLAGGPEAAGVRYGNAVEAVQDDGSVVFADGSRGRYDLVVGADGVDSAVRESAFEGVDPVFLGQICWRFLAPAGDLPAGTWTARLGSRGRTLLTLPIGDGDVYCFAAVDSRVPEPPGGDWREIFADFDTGGLLDHARNAHFAALREVRGDDWIRPHAVLLGDAAHACSPSMAQGGAMALEDAVVLAEVLAEVLAGARTRDDLPGALAEYRRRRAPRIRFVLAQNRRRDRARALPGPVRAVLFRHLGLPVIRRNHAGLLARP